MAKQNTKEQMMKIVLVVDSKKNRDISSAIGLEKSEYLRVTVHSWKAARNAIDTVQFDIVLLGSLPDEGVPLILLAELEKFVPRVLTIPELIKAEDSTIAGEST